MKGIMTRMKDMIMSNVDFEDEDEEFEEVEHKVESIPRPRQPLPMQPKLTPITNAVQDKMEILNFTMSNYEMTGEVAAYIKNKKPIIVNMKNLTPGEVQRAVDYLTGACYALNGSVECITDQIYIFAPESVNITPEVIKQKNIWPTV